MCLAVPGRVLSIAEVDGTLMAEVDFGGVRKNVCLQYIPDATVGEYVVVHVGFAIQRLDEASAQETLANFERMGILEQEFGDGFARAAEAGGSGAMKYLDEFSNPDLARKLLDQIHAATTRPWAMMEVCGGQTHSIIRHGIDQLLPDGVEMIHGPGCPVCVTPLEIIDKALAIAAQPGVIFCSFGDMLRVPGSSQDLFGIKSAGGDVRVVYSPLDALTIARENPDRQVVFFGIGFETTAPANAMTVYQAKRLGVRELLAAGVARAGAAGDRGHHGVAALPGAGVPGRRARVQRDGHRASTRRWPRSTACRSWSPASSRWTSWRASGRPSCSSRPGGTSCRTRTRGRSAPRATWPRWRCCATCSR